jgi:hypothetical protein
MPAFGIYYCLRLSQYQSHGGAEKLGQLKEEQWPHQKLNDSPSCSIALQQAKET